MAPQLMEASVRLLTPSIATGSSSSLNRHLISLSLHTHHHPLKISQFSSSLINSNSSSSNPCFLSLSLGSLGSHSHPLFFNSNSNRSSLHPSPSTLAADRGWELRVVLLGWLGAEERHLKRYSDLYVARGIPAVPFVVPVSDVLGFDLGRRVHARITLFSDDLIRWLSLSDTHGRQRALLFHTFSNTGWFTYGAILDNMRARGDFSDKIKGCVIDSGGDPELNPQVWAAGFAAALLKKRWSTPNSSINAVGENALDGEKSSIHTQDANTPLIETMLLFILEKFFSKILILPDVNHRLTNIINILSDNQPPCPQLYLYSTADKVIPASSIESFVEEQKKSGRKIMAHNFGLSPHVDHFRSFPNIYSAQIYDFLNECIPDYLTDHVAQQTLLGAAAKNNVLEQ